MEAVNTSYEDTWKDMEGEIPHPVVVVVGAEDGPYWCNTPPPEVNITMWSSNPSSGTGTPNTRSPSLNSFCSEASWSDASDDSVFKSNSNRSRHASTEVLSCSHGFLTAATERLCASQDHLDTSKVKERQQPRKGLDKPEGRGRERSASCVPDERRDTSPHSKVKKFFSRMRSNSHHELMLHGRSRGGSCVEAEKLEETLEPEPREVPPAAINARLLDRFRKHGLDLKKRRWSAWEDRVHIFRLRGHRTEEEGPELTKPQAPPPTDPVVEDSPAGPETVPDKPLLSRTRSNSESTIVTGKKKRHRGVRNLLMDIHYRKKHGSMPSLVVEEQKRQQQQGEAPSASPRKEEDSSGSWEKRAASCHNLTDLAVDDYFSDGTFSEDETDGERPRALPLGVNGHPHPHGRHRRPRFSIDNIWSVIKR